MVDVAALSFIKDQYSLSSTESFYYLKSTSDYLQLQQYVLRGLTSEYGRLPRWISAREIENTASLIRACTSAFVAYRAQQASESHRKYELNHQVDHFSRYLNKGRSILEGISDKRMMDVPTSGHVDFTDIASWKLDYEQFLHLYYGLLLFENRSPSEIMTGFFLDDPPHQSLISCNGQQYALSDLLSLDCPDFLSDTYFLKSENAGLPVEYEILSINCKDTSINQLQHDPTFTECTFLLGSNIFERAKEDYTLRYQTIERRIALNHFLSVESYEIVSPASLFVEQKLSNLEILIRKGTARLSRLIELNASSITIDHEKRMIETKRYICRAIKLNKRWLEDVISR